MENTILVTGGAGFVGSNFILQRLERDSAPIVNLDKLTYAGNLRNLDSTANPAPSSTLPPRATWIAPSWGRMISSARTWMELSRFWKKCGHIGEVWASKRKQISVFYRFPRTRFT